MRLKAHTLLMITSFVPVIAFKVIARTGAADLRHARGAAVIGLMLAAVQYVLSRMLMKRTTYLERAFLAFLAVAAIWVYIMPARAGLFVTHSTTLLYALLFLTTLLPQAFGFDPFTYAIAKQWYPETVWKVPQFRTINLHITYVWSSVFFAAALSCFLGDGRPLYSIILPLALVLGIGLPFSMRYPAYYLKRKFPASSTDPSLFPDTARELIARMPFAFRADAVPGLTATIQFLLSGEGGGDMFLSIADGHCTAHEGVHLSPTLAIRSSAQVWLKIARGEVDRPRAMMDGLFSAQGDMTLLTKMGEIFRPSPAREAEDLSEEKISHTEGRKKNMKILAIQGSPRPKASNTEKLLQQFLNGARSEGAEVETIYLKEKEIHPCIGCYTCWTKTPGVCVFKDDMPELLEKVMGTDLLVYATPLYVYNVSALTKAFQERLLPLLDPHLVKEGETYRHPKRYDRSYNIVLVSTCGFPEISHFDGLRRVFRYLERPGQALVGELLVPGAELVLRQDFMRERAAGLLQAVFKAGVEVVSNGAVSKETEARVQQAVVSHEDLAQMANMWWDSLHEGTTKTAAGQVTGVEDMRLLLRGMAMTFNASAAGNLTATIQFDVTGEQPGQWFLSIQDGACTFHEGMTQSPTLTIKTPSEVWIAIANKEKDGQKAFMAGEYKVEGDLGLLMRLSSLFGSKA
jgi:multimeric flavodoxin WrbA/putative sterol carrier protein